MHRRRTDRHHAFAGILSAGRVGRPRPVPPVQSRTTFTVLAAVAGGHFINDLLQSLLPSIYPMLKQSFGLSFRQIGLITLVSQITASLLQPVIGVYTDRRPQPHWLWLRPAATR